MRKLVSLVQVNFRQGPTWKNIYFLPYSVGCLWSYANSFDDVRESFELDAVVWRRDSITDLAPRLATNSLVAFSTYIWNRNYNYELARRIKDINPNTVIVFGGPEPALTDPDLFRSHPYIDLIIKREGELVFLDVLRAIDQGRALASIPGVLLNDQGNVYDTGDSSRIDDLSVLPSPYLTGFFDQIIDQNPDVHWNMTIETNRGCPYQCTFCDWGGLTYTKVKLMPMERVFGEIEWCGNLGAGLYIADANFGMFVDRDSETVDKIIKVNRETKGMDMFYTSWAKNQKNDVVKLISRLANETDIITNGLTVSVQSMTPEVLDIIKRTNLKQHRIREIFDLARQYNVMCYTELILGLPGESADSFKETVFQVLRAGNHHGVEINQSQLLENAEMNTVQKAIYEIQSLEASDYLTPWWDPSQGPQETIAVVKQTNTISEQEMVDLYAWLSFIQAFHFYGFTTQISQFLYKFAAVDYAEFYQHLYEKFTHTPKLASRLDRVRDQFRDWFKHGKLVSQLTDQVEVNGITLWQGLNLLLHVENLVEDVDKITRDLLLEQYQDRVPTMMLNQLLQYQQQRTLTYDKSHRSSDVCLEFDFDFPGYIDQDRELERRTAVTFSTREFQKNLAKKPFFETIFFRRRQRVGLLDIKVDHEETVEF
jgi:putative methyltransferase